VAKLGESAGRESRPSATTEDASSAKPRIVQVELKKALRRMGARASSRSPFRFTDTSGRQSPRLHAVLNRHALDEAQASFRLRHPGQPRRRLQAEKDNLSRFVDLHFPGNSDIQAILRELRALPQVEQAAEVPEIVTSAFPTDPLVGTSDQPTNNPILMRDCQWYIFRCGINRAWASVSGNGVVIADVDGGFFLDHQDLAPNVERNHTHNAVDGSNDVTAGPKQDHGTAVLGLAAAASNALGIAGVAFSAKLWPVQYTAGNGAPLGGLPLVNAIDWVTGEDSGGRRVVINVEAQSNPRHGNIEQIPAVGEAIRQAIAKGFVVCVAAGNGDVDAGLADDGVTAIEPTGSILVGATAFDPANPAANPRATAPGGQSSNWGARIVVSAPGDIAHDVTCGDGSKTDYINAFGGTSGAVAKVAGAVALMLEANPALTPGQVGSILVQTGSPLNTDKPIGVFLNAAAAVTAALQSRSA
jgi:subtilisin family serine protease